MKCKSCEITDSYFQGECLICIHGKAEELASERAKVVDLDALTALLNSYIGKAYLKYYSIDHLLRDSLRFNLWTKEVENDSSNC